MAADAGADLALVFSRNHEEALAASGRSKIPLVCVQSRGNRDGRPLYSEARMTEMGYVACVDAILYLAVTGFSRRRGVPGRPPDGLRFFRRRRGRGSKDPDGRSGEAGSA